MSYALQVENLSKAYQLGEIGTGTITRDVERWYARIRGREDPFLKIGEVNDRTSKGGDVIWSLRDIHFEIGRGEAVGIIGANGAGKSTLLKILSRITSPTTGRVRGRGRVSSLLEIGIGFNPELTGRENIFLNGAILGMRKAEIKSHFDNIVEFAGVERYIDTPVKRYSSGMYVRLAFAVAAHLESEILIVDEVLAVGDSEFQKKCLGKMGDISKGEGRTVLFVSHTMSAIKQLCNRAILLNRGMLELDGDSRSVISHYLANGLAGDAGEIALPLNEAAELSFTRISVMSSKGGQNVIRNDDDFVITAMFTVSCQVEDVEISFCLENASGVKVLFTSLSDTRQGAMLSLKPGGYTVSATVGGNFLLPETYRISIYAHQRNIRNIDYREQVIRVTIVDLGSYMAPYGSAASDLCCALKECSWELLKT